MLSELELERYITPILQRQAEINQFVIETICKRINEIGKMNVSDVHRLNSLYRMGADARLINAEIARLTGLNVQDIKGMIRQIALVDYMDTKPFYDYRHKPFIPFKENKQLINYVNAMANQTALQYKNVSKAQGFMLRDPKTNQLKMTSISKTYQHVVDKAIQATSQGTLDYNTAMRNTIQELVDSGLRRVEYNTPSGRQYSQRVDTAVRRNLLDGVRAMNQGTKNINKGGNCMSTNNEDKVSNTLNSQKEEKDMDSRLYALSNDNPENRVKYIDEPMLDLMYRK